MRAFKYWAAWGCACRSAELEEDRLAALLDSVVAEERERIASQFDEIDDGDSCEARETETSRRIREGGGR